MHDFRRLEVWQLARSVALRADELTRKFPRADRGVLARQLRRSSLSVPSNIAEACGKSSRRETVRFLEIASGSASETESHLLIAGDLGYVHPKQREELLGNVKSIQRMLYRLIQNIP